MLTVPVEKRGKLFTFYRPIGIFILENFVLIFARMSGVK